MKNVFLLTLLVTSILPGQIFGQNTNGTYFMSQKDIIGTWQRNYKIIGSGLAQNFEFFANGTFVLNLCNSSEDVRNTIAINGKYRIEKNKLFFTITSKTVNDGIIEVADMGVSSRIFEINGLIKVIQEANPKEISEPCYITIITKNNIKLGNEIYYKVK